MSQMSVCNLIVAGWARARAGAASCLCGSMFIHVSDVYDLSSFLQQLLTGDICILTDNTKCFTAF